LKKFLSGNEAIALGAIRAGVSLVTGYPGTPSTEILETVARETAAKEAGARFPGIHVEWSVNEKTAMETAAGAAIAGSRSMVIMQQSGLNIALDPLINLNYLGVSGALVVVSADDPGLTSAFSLQDTRHFARGMKIAVFDPSTTEEAYHMTADAFDYSEKYGRPVILRPTTQICHSYAAMDPETLPYRALETRSHFSRGGGRWITLSPEAREAPEKVNADIEKMHADFSSYRGNSLIVTPEETYTLSQDSLPGGSGQLGIASGGVSYSYVMEILNPLPPGIKILKAGTFPFPDEMALSFLESLEEVLVLEELDPVIEEYLTRLCGSRHLRTSIRGKRSGDMPWSGEYTPALALEKIEGFLKRKVWVHISDLSKEKLPNTEKNPLPEIPSLASAPPAALAAAAAAADVLTQPLPDPPPLPLRPLELCAGCPHMGSFFAVREAVRKFGRGRKAVFSGDLGCYALGGAKPFEMIDTCLSMGAGTAMAQGIGRVEPGLLNFAFIGDATFFHSGVSALMNAVYNRSDIIIVVLDNGSSAISGNQSHPGVAASGVAASGVGGCTGISIPALAEAFGIKEIFRAEAFDTEAAVKAIGQVMEKTGVRLVILSGPCIYNAKGNAGAKGPGEKKNGFTIGAGKCNGCKDCIRMTGCPAIALKTTEIQVGRSKMTAQIDPGLCTGCGLCKALCSTGAIFPTMTQEER